MAEKSKDKSFNSSDTSVIQEEKNIGKDTASVSVAKHSSPGFCTVSVEKGEVLSTRATVIKGDHLWVTLYQEGARNTWRGTLFGLSFCDGDEKTVSVRDGRYTAEVEGRNGSEGMITLVAEKSEELTENEE